MIREIMFAVGLILFSAQVRAANYFSTGTTSVFTDGATWLTTLGVAYPSGTPAPTSTDKVFLNTATAVTLVAPASVEDIYFYPNSTLALGAQNLTINSILASYLDMNSPSITGTGAIVFSDANIAVYTNSIITIPNLTLSNPTATRTFYLAMQTSPSPLSNSSLIITALTGIPTTSSGKGFIFNASLSLGGSITFPVGTTITFCDKVGNVINLTCTNPAGAAAPAPVSAPIDSLLNTKSVTFSREVTR